LKGNRSLQKEKGTAFSSFLPTPLPRLSVSTENSKRTRNGGLLENDVVSHFNERNGKKKKRRKHGRDSADKNPQNSIENNVFHAPYAAKGTMRWRKDDTRKETRDTKEPGEKRRTEKINQ
jgi:hypothetical protein